MKIIYTKTFEKSLFKLDKNIQIRIIEKLELFYKIKDSIYDLNLDIKKLQPKEKLIYRFRIGKYRILFININGTIKLLDVDNRDSIYM